MCQAWELAIDTPPELFSLWTTRFADDVLDINPVESEIWIAGFYILRAPFWVWVACTSNLACWNYASWYVLNAVGRSFISLRSTVDHLIDPYIFKGLDYLKIGSNWAL